MFNTINNIIYILSALEWKSRSRNIETLTFISQNEISKGNVYIDFKIINFSSLKTTNKDNWLNNFGVLKLPRIGRKGWKIWEWRNKLIAYLSQPKDNGKISTVDESKHSGISIYVRYVNLSTRTTLNKDNESFWVHLNMSEN